jgi:hypothetical protein
MGQQHREIPPGFRLRWIVRNRGLNHCGGCLPPFRRQILRHLVNGDSLDESVH